MVEVHGKVIAGGVMLVWPFDIVIASEDATFQDNTVAMGICGAEFFNHPYELGVRKAKEMLFTSDEVSAADALRLGAVNHVAVSITRGGDTEAREGDGPEDPTVRVEILDAADQPLVTVTPDASLVATLRRRVARRCPRSAAPASRIFGSSMRSRNGLPRSVTPSTRRYGPSSGARGQERSPRGGRPQPCGPMLRGGPRDAGRGLLGACAVEVSRSETSNATVRSRSELAP